MKQNTINDVSKDSSIELYKQEKLPLGVAFNVDPCNLNTEFWTM